ncbi:Isotrichodermin C-15 hydroxylase [Neolecta irregularis DAH-3]|uniref:Isotrichodermin C-15 hydroxylase n=1 Tax=Neolecta irregularis (strain DAH-3) TaxID=1198029 RepID=A0A1U7LGY6_NEOID|nr:Isotrichodermin C-15 hydroxylase [Neolecta irregularis DAH-3]|eukprot:OLL21888.1 Isotrichodermin C-15 hydroxylase [Neolecta irregularis DAH-3]
MQIICNLGFASFVVLLSWIIADVIYKIFFHPLAKYKGPLLAKVTPLWYFYIAYEGKRHLVLQKLHKKYGTFVRIAPNEVSISDYRALMSIYGHDPGCEKSSGYVAFQPTEDSPSLVSVRDRGLHSRMRKPLNKAFSQRAIESMEPLIKEQIDVFCHSLSKFGKNGKIPLDITQWVTYLTFDVLGKLCFGENFDMITTGNANCIIEMAQCLIKVSTMYATCPALIPLRNLITPHSLIQKRERMIQEANEKLDRRLRRTPEHKDFISFLVEDKDADVYYSEDRSMLHAAAQLLIVAGADTTSSSITSSIFHLLQNPQIYSKLCAEIRPLFTSKNEIVHQAVASLPYLNAVLEESMRISSPVPANLPRISPPEGCTIAGEILPGGIDFSVPTYALNLDERYFTRPNEFIPERWIIKEGFEKDWEYGRLAYQPFSIGPRACLGRTMAYMEMRLVIAQWIWTFDAEIVDKDLKYDVEDWTVAIKPEILVRNTLRKDVIVL